MRRSWLVSVILGGGVGLACLLGPREGTPNPIMAAGPDVAGGGDLDLASHDGLAPALSDSLDGAVAPDDDGDRLGGRPLAGARRSPETPPAEPDEWRKVADAVHERSGRRHSTTSEVLVRPAWTDFLACWLRLPPPQDERAHRARFEEVLSRATDPVVRQNLIFLAALTLPDEVSGPWLGSLRDGPDPEDAEDALVALAFRGHPEDVVAFARLATTPSPAHVHRLFDWSSIHLEEFSRGPDADVRAVLRSYRAIEVFRACPYYLIVALEASYDFGDTRGMGARLGWRPRALSDPVRDRALLTSWLQRYPGHPGGDNVATWIGYDELTRGDPLEGLRWMSLASVLPDQEEAWRPVCVLQAACELALSPEEVREVGRGLGTVAPNRAYAAYVAVRRLGAERGVEVGLRAWADQAVADPEGVLAIAYARRWAVPATKALDSGVTPLPPDDPLRRIQAQAPAWPARTGPSWTQRGTHLGVCFGDEGCLHPSLEPARLDRERLERQARCWETLAELERRAQRARGDARADLLYKQAALLYHERDAFFPAYGHHDQRFRERLSDDVPNAFREPTTDRAARLAEQARRDAPWDAAAISYLRALALFERIEREHAGWEGMDRVVFSQGLAWRQLADYRPYLATGGSEARRLAAVRATLAAFERVARDHARSPLAESARAAAAYWRGVLLRRSQR